MNRNPLQAQTPAFPDDALTTVGTTVSVHELFEAQALAAPDFIAVLSADRQLSYGELNDKANQLARFLINQGVVPGSRVAVCLERSVEMVVSLLAILKAGGAYVPLDPNYPPERLRYMVADSEPSLILTQDELVSLLPSSSASTVSVDVELKRIYAFVTDNVSPVELGLESRHPVYVIYTSGSTGQPKGTVMPHSAVVNLIEWHRVGLGSCAAQRVLQYAALSFDVAFQEIFSTICGGGTLVLLREWERRDARVLTEILVERSVQRLFLPPLMLQSLADYSCASGVLPSALRDVITAGEQLRITPEIKTFFRRITGSRLHNHYGPTETHVVTALTLTGNPDEWPALPPIGFPIANTQVHLLDGFGKPVPTGEVGEMYLGGACVSSGYLGRTELTQQRFVADTCSTDPHARLYKSGDLGRWLPDNSLQYLGRNDDQVKIRGFRVELGEVESQLGRQATVKDAVVIVREDVPGTRRLVAYLTASASARINIERVRASLQATLPDYMVPSAFVVLDELPRTHNGKLDRHKLPQPDASAYVVRPYQAPQGDFETKLAQIWQDLLRIDRVGRRDNFFELGGDSLLMVQLMERLRRAGLSADVRQMFGSQSLAELAGSLVPLAAVARTDNHTLPLVDLTPREIESIGALVSGGVRNIKDIYPLAPLQEGLLFHHLLNAKGGDTYVLPTLLSVASSEKLQQLITAMQQVVDRHDALRSAVLWEGLPRPLQVVLRQATLPVKQLQLDPDHDVLERMTELMQPLHQQMNLREAPLLRLSIAPARTGAEWYVLIQMHHLVCDHQSLELVLSEIRAHLQGDAAALPAPLSYRTHVAQVLDNARAHDAERFFRDKLGDVDEPSTPFNLIDMRGDASRIEECQLAFDADLSQRIRSQARANSVSPATLFHVAWGLVVSKTTGRHDVVYGTLLLGRLQGEAGAQPIVGMFINTLPLRLRLRVATIRELIRQTHSELVDLLAHEQASLAVAQRCSGLPGSTPLFNTLLNYRHRVEQRAPNDSELVPGIRVVGSQRRTNYPITVSIDDLEEGFTLSVQTDRRVEPEQIADCLRQAMTSLVKSLEQGGEAPPLALPVLSVSARNRIIHDFNLPQLSFPDNRLIHELLEERVRAAPDAIAMVYEGERITYAELNARANQLARYLRQRGVRTGQLVAICLERSIEMLVSIVGVLKAGGAYVPLDPNYPSARLSYILGDSSPRLSITSRTLQARLQGVTTELVALDTEWSEIARGDSNDLAPREVGVTPNDLAYIIYTSGSTGNPKGVMVEHANVTRLFFATDAWFHFGPDDVWTAFHSFSFDFSVWEIWGALLYGGRLVVVPQLTARSPEDFYALLCAERVTVLNQTPSAFAQLVDAQGRSGGRQHSLRMVIFGGEGLELRTLRPWVERNGAQKPQLINMYGITETTVHVTYHPVSEAEILSGQSGLVGRPIPDLQVYLLDEHMDPVPVGVAGEIYVGGAGLARGYLGRPDLTEQRFVANPFASSGRLYRSGDVGRWRSDGQLEHLGRNDHQVKIRGHRIELGEIESRLAECTAIRDVAVIVREDVPGEKRLVAYVTFHVGKNLSTEELREHAAAGLPAYMVPSAFACLDQLPLTSNGKLDRRALPVPELGAFSDRPYEAPRGEVEETLAGVWAQLLRVERVGRHDNFFELGGHSLLIVQLIERLRRVGLSTEVRRIFEKPTLEDLAKSLSGEAAPDFIVPANQIPAGSQTITPSMLPLVSLEPEHIAQIVATVPGGAVNIQDIYPLAPLQEGILFHHLMSDHSGDTYVLPTLMVLSDRKRLNQLVQALQSVIDRHDALRTAVLWDGLRRPVQVVYRDAPLSFEEITLEVDRDPVEQMREYMRADRQRLDLRRAPLMRLQVAAEPGGNQWYALLQLHHLTTDHMAQEIVIAEVGAFLDGHAASLPEPIPYRNHVAQALAHANTRDAEEFFRRKLGDVDESTAPFGLFDVHGNGVRIEEYRHRIASDLAARIRTRARRCGVSAATLFHAAWALVVARTSNRRDVVFGSVLLGRLQVSSGAQRILGMFINTLPLRVRLDGICAKDLVDITQRELVELLHHEQASLATAQHCSSMSGSAPLFTSLLNFRHGVADPQGEQQITAEGLRVLAMDEWTNYPITVSVDDLEQDFLVTASTDRRIRPQRMTTYLQTALESLVDALEAAPETPALQLHTLPEEESQQVLRGFNNTAVPCPDDKLVHELFENQVALTPDAIAVEHGQERLTYIQLNRRADKFAASLALRGVGQGDVVAVCFERGVEMVVGLLGVLKSGAAYMPLDPSLPEERQRQMLNDAVPKLVLTQSDLELGGVYAVEEKGHPRQLVYVIYTSGSTGRPKGTAMTHRSMVNLIEWHRGAGLNAAGQRVLQFAALSFDVAFQETFSTLCTGGTLILIDEWLRKEPRALSELLISKSVQRLFVPPLMLQNLAEYSAATGLVPNSLRDVIVAGEALRVSPEITDLFEQLPGCRLHNHYGPTESHVVTALTLPDVPSTWPALPPIGRPIANTQIYVLDGGLQPAPVDVEGEIYIGGAGVAIGYRDRPELTAQRFIANPYGDGTLYKTGDLGCWRSDGTLEYRGRNDYQVKLRGYRIELGEVETQLARYPGVQTVAVVIREDSPGNKRLVAYFVASEQEKPDSEALREHLNTVLPEYMVPSAFVELDRLPLTATGKLDRRALPAPDADAYANEEFSEPEGETEKLLAKVWQELLRVPRIGRNDNFFELGGHSLLAMQAMVRIRTALGLDIPIRTLFENPSLRLFATEVRTRRELQLLHDVDRGDEDMEQLLDSVASMPASQVRELLRGLTSKGAL